MYPKRPVIAPKFPRAIDATVASIDLLKKQQHDRCALCEEDLTEGWCTEWSDGLRIVCSACFREANPLVAVSRW